MNSILKAKRELFIRVGGSTADICGFNSTAIQMAADVLKTHGGGVIELSDGIFDMMGPVRLYNNTCLKGQGKTTVLKKSEGFSSAFKEDVDYGAFIARLIDTGGFKVGAGILITDSVNSYDWNTSTSKIVAIEGDAIFFDRHTLANYTKGKNGVISNACSLVEAIKADDVKISKLSIDGSKENNFKMDGCRGGAIYLHKASKCTVEDVMVCNYNGDGISWQITEDITVRGTEVSGCTGFGMHPGTGSERTLVENCHMHDNGRDGMYVCWKVKNSIFRNNEFCNNNVNGVSIGHKDTDNIFENNHIHHNGMAGITIRAESEGNNADRNVYRHNTIENNGNGKVGYGFLFETAVEGNVIEENIIRDTGKGRQKTGISCNGGHTWLNLRGNIMSGHAMDI